MLNTIFSSEISPDAKKKMLSEKYNIAMTAELETEVLDMCNLGSAIERKGIEKGRNQGIDIGEFKTTVKYCKRGAISVEQAAKDLNMTVEEFTRKMNQLSKDVANA